jgi:NTE family protein
MLVLPQDIADYGIKPDDLSVAKAVRMSMSIPFFFEPVSLEAKSATGKSVRCYIVDGGLLSNFPVHLFDAPGEPAWPTFGFDLRAHDPAKPARIRGPLSLAMAIFNTMMSSMDRRYIEEKNWDRTIAVRTKGVGLLDFDITRAKRDALYAAGEKGAREFFESWWDWDKHVTARRKNVAIEELAPDVAPTA